ncbi:TPA: traD [Staphylococcus aureus]|uniref:TrsD/TraD family conjugative transfer protein n=1 Tax=Staphylococcus capitis TaxID=29388 RepID=UPI0018C612D9|nr:traD [Staphylococcus aureus]HAY1011891.1 traD [Staphylococcus aureus]HCV2138969.1 traD [Staphylococcus aureus]HCV8805783.1 traD [Staphylococcus aureus]HCY8983446.1 traD [Staphylococcus aureus]
MFKKKKKKQDNQNEQQFEIINRYIKGDGRNKTVQEDSLIAGFYKDYVVTKDGYVCGGLNITGVNTELLTKFEQNDLLEEYSSYIANSIYDEPMLKTITEPVNIQNYIKHLYREVLLDMKENNNKPTRRGQLIAGRILFLQDKLAKGEMSTKKHYIFMKEKIAENTVAQLDHAVDRLYDKININKEAIKQAFSHYGLEVRPIYQQEYVNQFYALYDYKAYNDYHLSN